MDDWLFYALLSVVQLSVLMALYKVPAAKQVNKYVFSAWSYLFGTLLAGMALHSFVTIDPLTILLSLLWGTGYAVLTLLQMHALHSHDTSSVFPFTSVASNALVVAGGVLLLREQITVMEWLAIALAIALFFGMHSVRETHFKRSVLPLFLGIAFLSTINKFVQKAGADYTVPYDFMFWQMAFALVASISILWFLRKRVEKGHYMGQPLLFWSIGAGALQFGSTYTIVMALSLGPISLVYTVLMLYLFFTTLIASIFFKERLTAKSLGIILLSFLIVLLIKLG